MLEGQGPFKVVGVQWPVTRLWEALRGLDDDAIMFRNGGDGVWRMEERSASDLSLH